MPNLVVGQILAAESDAIPMGKFWHQNQTASQWTNSGIRIRWHPNGQILAAESEAISGSKIRWHSNGQILVPESDTIPIF
jgi:hypothetical protein